MDSLIQRDIDRIFNLNKKLLGVIRNIGFDLLHFADEYNYPIPPNLRNYFDEADKLITELNHPTSIDKRCSICEKLNPENADFCCYCGSSLGITRMRQNNESPSNATEGYHLSC